MSFSYSLYGLDLRSNVQLPGLWHSETSRLPDVEITLGKFDQVADFPTEPWHTSSYLDENGKPYLTVWKSNDSSSFHIVYGDATEFLVDRTGTRVSAIWPASLNLENTTVYLVGQIAAFILRLRGVVCLHASSVLVDDRVLAIAGNSGAGKSSTAATFARLGYPVLTEDVTTLTDRSSHFLVQPGYPRVNLWPEAVACVRDSDESLPLIAPTWNKTYLDLERYGERFYKRPARLGGVYVLNERSMSDSAPFINRLTGGEGLLALLTNAHGRYLLEKPMRRREFELLSRVSHQVPIRSAVPHTDLSRLDSLCEAIIADYKDSLSQPVLERGEETFV
ncbi:MAG TPA: hypothetical protein VJU86_08110 [Pyrinomonadaceae bacterium]|nr:hypothetical protein [Pyrinomonadaceae bacterium]